MRDSRARIILLSMAGIAACLLAVAFARETCRIPGSEYACTLAAVADMLRDEGVAPALAYIDEEIKGRIGYSGTHFILHTAGEYAYQTSGSLEAALAYFAPYEKYAPDGRNLYGFDGFIHGVLSSHVLASGPARHEEVMREVCEGGVVIPGITDRTYTCYHALGHALVHAKANDLDAAAATCASLTGERRDGCYYGAFMEIMYLYIPEYHEGAPRPDSAGGSMAGLCERLGEEARSSCEHFVGQSYLNAHPDDIAGAFNECSLLGEGSETCALRLGQISVTSQVSNEEQARAFCAKHAGVLEEVCYKGTVSGIEAGLGR